MSQQQGGSRSQRKRKANSSAQGQPQQKKRKSQGQQKRQRKRRARNGRAMSGRGGADVSVLGGGAASFFAPVSQGTVMKKIQPHYAVKNANEMRIIHREKVAKLTTPGTGVFTILKAIALNPGLAASFPWLSNESAGYESYRFNRIRYIWVPAVGTAVAGSVIMGPDYDAADAAPVGETALSSYTDAEEGNVWIPFTCDLEGDLLNGEQRRKFVRNGALGANLDIKTYDSGNLFVASSDDSVANVGKLWVEYDVSLYNPQVPPGGFFSTGYMSGAGALAAATPFGASQTSGGSPSLSCSGLVVTASALVIGQEYLVSANLIGTVITAFTFVASTGATLKFGPAGTTQVNGAGTDATQWETFTATAETATFTLTVTATTITNSVFVMSVLAPVPAF